MIDILVLNTKIEDWRIWTDFVNADYRVEWYEDGSEISKEKIDFDFVKKYLTDHKHSHSFAKVFAGNLQIHAHFLMRKLRMTLTLKSFKP